eukprot:CAMPEP_0113955044 /NCGR_PEP_ID=MMETSP0011_2-20120614/1032_1 /TAXON_ID=101924 /ORGANISM="Rhodosorus marinus" /LENGTH=85 /DNA_ID=CAMNT_0000964525 /DNA_START=135 /DNA_END=393 /DNA_ORIENTATION=+ /assembly_acc=CAM_ASM_000156
MPFSSSIALDVPLESWTCQERVPPEHTPVQLRIDLIQNTVDSREGGGRETPARLSGLLGIVQFPEERQMRVSRSAAVNNDSLLPD